MSAKNATSKNTQMTFGVQKASAAKIDTIEEVTKKKAKGYMQMTFTRMTKVDNTLNPVLNKSVSTRNTRLGRQTNVITSARNTASFSNLKPRKVSEGPAVAAAATEKLKKAPAATEKLKQVSATQASTVYSDPSPVEAKFQKFNSSLGSDKNSKSIEVRKFEEPRPSYTPAEIK